jgi:large subunit ribosomal protein L15
MNLQSLPKVKAISDKRLGRGLGSGKGKTGGRGQKGQKARGKIPAQFTGGGLPLYKKLPLLRGWGNRKAAPKEITLTLTQLSVFKANEVVDVESLIAKKLVDQDEVGAKGVKVLGGELDKALTVKVPVSTPAREKIEKLGGTVG